MDWDFPGKNTGVGCHFLFPGDLPDLEIEPLSPASVSYIAGRFFTAGPPEKPLATVQCPKIGALNFFV